MASLRRQIVDAGVARVNALGNGWEATSRDRRNPRRGEKLAVFVAARESKQSDSWFYECTLTLLVGVLAYHENSGPSMVYEFLDELITDIEKAVHVDSNETWGIPAVTDLTIAGSQKFAPDPKKNIAIGEVEIRVRYRHNIGNPEFYGYPPP